MLDSVLTAAVLCLLVFVSEWLVRRSALRHVGTALVVILLAAVASNIGLIPSGALTEPEPVYDGIFRYVAPLSIFLLLLPANLSDIRTAGAPMIGIFVVGVAGTSFGVIAGLMLIDPVATIGPSFAAVGGMFAATYTGGSVNFNALALHYEIIRDGILYAGATVVDNVATTIWMVATIGLPRLLRPVWGGRKKRSSGAAPDGRDVLTGIDEDTESLHPADVGLVLGVGLLAVWLSEQSASLLSRQGIDVPSILVLTVFALALAQWRRISNLKGVRSLGLFTVYVFLAVIGAYCDVSALVQLGSLGPALLVLVTVVMIVHGVFCYGAAWLFRLDPEVASVASQANIGGATSALAVARSLGRGDLVLPGVLVGALGNAAGTFVGFWLAESIIPFLFTVP